MKVTTNVFGLEFDIETPFNTVEEFDNLAGMVGACLNEATQHVLAHKHLNRVRAAVCKKAEELTGIERAKTTDGDGKSIKYSESEQTYFKRVVAECAGRDDWNDIEAALKDTAASVKFELVVTRSRVTKEGLAMADALINGGKAEAFAAKYGIELPSDPEEMRNVLALEVKKVIDEQQRQAKASLVAGL